MVYDKTPWRSRFEQPSPPTLLRGLPEPFREALGTLRQHLNRQPDVSEEVVWYGLNWCWSIEYRVGRELLVVVIPSPSDLQLAMPIDPGFIATLPLSRLKRAVRDGLELGQEPFDTRWAVWSIPHETIVPELQDLVSRRRRHLDG